MSAVWSAFVEYAVAARRKRDVQCRHPIPPGRWRDVVNGIVLACAAFLAVLAVVLTLFLWRMATDDMLGILFLMLFPFAVPAVFAIVGMVVGAIGFVRRP